MSRHESINHVTIIITNLDDAMRFFRPSLEFFGYTAGDVIPYAGTRLTVNIHSTHGAAINVWKAKHAHPFDDYEPGLQHIASDAGSKDEVDAAAEIVRDAGLGILDGPGEFPFANGCYYALYFLGPDKLKFDVVHMPSLDS